jgi:hypothetical protein
VKASVKHNHVSLSYKEIGGAFYEITEVEMHVDD